MISWILKILTGDESVYLIDGDYCRVAYGCGPIPNDFGYERLDGIIRISDKLEIVKDYKTGIYIQNIKPDFNILKEIVSKSESLGFIHTEFHDLGKKFHEFS